MSGTPWHLDWQYYACRHQFCPTAHAPAAGSRYEPSPCPECGVASAPLQVRHEEPS